MAVPTKAQRVQFRNDLTVDYVRSILSYNPRTGLMKWKLRLSNPRFSHGGKKAGTLGRNGYVALGIRDKKYSAHRLAWLIVTGSWPKHEIDHKNTDRADNRWKNLREATTSQNRCNVKNRNKYKYKGVKRQHNGQFTAFIAISGKSVYLGNFNTAEKAHAAYRSAAKKLHGNFARFN